MSKQTKIVTVIALILAAVGMAWYGLSQKQSQSAQQTTEPIKIGQVTPLTGDYGWAGELEKQGADLALEEINAKGGINGRKLVIVREDDKMDPAQSVTAITKLIGVDKVQAVIGMASSGGTLAAAPIAEKDQVVLLSPLATASKISNAGDYIFRLFPSAKQEADKLIEAAVHQGYKNAAIIDINNDYGSELAQLIQQKADFLGINVVASESYSSDATDFRTQLAKIAGKNPEAIFLMGYANDMTLVIKQAAEMGIKSSFLASDMFDVVQLATVGKAAEGVIYAIGDDKTSDAFKVAFKAKYGKEANIYEAMNYDAVNLLALAIQRGGNDGIAIKNELYKIHDYPGASGTINFDSNGDAVDHPMILKIVKDGKTIPYQQ
jgi:branched-chain amino acid transport system substrate-binding protein